VDLPKHVDDFAAMTDLSKEFRELLSASCRISAPPAERVEISLDGTEKTLFRLEDGEAVESVLIPDEDRRTLCASSQVGCALACGFCATGAMGFRRDMTSAEIVHQACFAAKRLADRGERLTNVVFMGMGEPLRNAREVSRAIEILLSSTGSASPARGSPSPPPGSCRRCWRWRNGIPSVSPSPSTPPGTTRDPCSCRSTGNTP